MIWVLTGVFLAVIALQVPGLVRDKMWRELGAFSFIMLLAMIYGYGQIFDLPLPNPIHGVELVFGPVADWVDQALGIPL